MTPNPDAHLVVKLGGSLWRSPDLAEWIAALGRYPHGVTIAPGGGPFADAVRAAQPAMRFSTGAAHRMAILGMEQYALALADLFPRLTAVETPAEAALAHRRGATALWRPFAMAGAAGDIAASWDVTSDSLAAWYAHKARAGTLLLVKSLDPPPGADLASEGVVDRCFRDYAAGLAIVVAGPAALAGAGAFFTAGALPGTPFDVTSFEQKIAS